MCAQSRLTLCDPMDWAVARQTPLSMGFSRQEYWRGLPFPTPGHLPNTGIEPPSSALADGFFTTSATWGALKITLWTEDEMAGWHHHLNGHGFVWTPGVGLARWGSLGHKESDTTERLNWTDLRCCLVAKLSPSLCYPTDCSPPGSSVHGIFQPRILEWVAISFSIVYL